MKAHAGSLRTAIAMLAIVSLVLAPVAQAQRTKLKSGWNMYSAEQDVEIGRQVSAQAEKELPMLNDRRVDNYLNNLGRRLAAKAPGEKFPYQFKAVNDSGINAFALPGGFLYVNRGIIEAADNEAQLAGVMAHEIGHVALRHGTNQASKQQLASVPLAVLGGAMGNSVGGLLAQLGAGFALNSVLLKYSRDAERQADTMGVQILYDNGYDPRAMSQFFEKIQAERKGGRMPEFFSSHPNPENRVSLTAAEVQRLGGAPRGYKTDSSEFRDIKRYVLSLPPAPKNAGQQSSGSGGSPQGSGRPVDPSGRYQRFENSRLTMDYPDNWRAYRQGDAATFAPEGGILQDRQGNSAVAYGMLINLYSPHADAGNQLQPEGYGAQRTQMTLEQATDQLIDELRHANPGMRITQQHERIRLAGSRGLSTFLTNDSPLGGRETNWLVTVMQPDGLLFFVAVAPQNEFSRYDNTFERMLDSVRFTGGSSLRFR